MSIVRKFWRCRSGSASVELLLASPIMLALLLGSVELGNYFYNEHILVKAVRDGARFAARQDFASYNGCNGSAVNVPTAVADATKLLVRKGSFDSSDPDLLSNWDSASLQFNVQMTCSTTAGTTTLAGIYSGNNTGTVGMAPVVLVTVRIPYRPILAGLGFNGFGMTLNATQQAAVMGL